jgi:hypothetical protein
MKRGLDLESNGFFSLEGERETTRGEKAIEFGRGGGVQIFLVGFY